MAKHTLAPDAEAPAGRPVGARIDWAATLAAHDRWLRAMVLVRLGEYQGVDEVMQDVALAAIAQQAPINDVSRVGAWLYRLAVRKVLQYRRKHGRQRRFLDNFAALRDDGAGLAASDPLDWLLSNERNRLIREAIMKLHRRDAEILVLKYVEDWSYRELAGHLGLTESAVEARLHRARQRLRAAMIRTHVIEVSE